MIPSGYRRVDIVVDSYIENSIKEAKRTRRGTAQKVIIQSMKLKFLEISMPFYATVRIKLV